MVRPYRKKNTSGFTIVELLIVIVVIAILAAISIVAYTGIQNRANDTAVQSDIANYAKKVMLVHAENGSYPAGAAASSPAGIGNFPLTQASYATDAANFYYCEGTISGAQVFAVGAESKSGNRYYHSSLNGGVQPYTGTWGGMVYNCTGMLPGVEAGYTRTYGLTSDGNWNSWTN